MQIKDKLENFRGVVQAYEAINEEIDQIQRSTIMTSQQKATLISLKQKALSATAEQMADDLTDIEDYLETLDDNELRAILRARYLLGDTWRQCTARILERPRSDAAKQRVYRLFKAMEEGQP